MAGETVITIVGNLTADPETRTTRNGTPVVNFTIAATPRVFNKSANQWEDGQGLFLRCTVWHELAEHCARSLSKGMRVIAQGRLQSRSYQAQDGSKRIITEMQVDEIGPSLRYALAQVVKDGRGGGQGNVNPQPAGFSQGFQNDQTNGFAPPASDPWSQPDDGGFSTFGASSGEPEF